jgi:hypothetical protein
MPAIIRQEHTWSPGASAITKDFTLKQMPIAAIVADWYMLGAGAAATIANALTQCMTKMYLQDGSEKITPEWSGAELYEYLSLFYGRIPPFQDGTAADNKGAYASLVLPMGRPQVLGNTGLLNLFDPHVGYNPVNEPTLHVSVPADGNSIDARHLEITVIYNTRKFRYSKKWTDFTSQTLSTSAFKDWSMGSKGAALEVFLYQTTSKNDTVTSDAVGLSEFEIVRSGSTAIPIFDGKNSGRCLSALQGSFDDDYMYLPFSHAPFDNFENCIALTGKTYFRVHGGVAEAMKCACSRIV